MNMNRKIFEKLVMETASDVVSALPDDLRKNAADVIFSVEDKPSRKDMNGDPDFEDTLGLYDGIPLNERSFSNADILPSRIILLRLPILDTCENIRELKTEIRTTILHELGHHFGFDEDELEERGLG